MPAYLTPLSFQLPIPPYLPLVSTHNEMFTMNTFLHLPPTLIIIVWGGIAYEKIGKAKRPQCHPDDNLPLNAQKIYHVYL